MKQALTSTTEKKHHCRMLPSASNSLPQETLAIHLNRCASKGRPLTAAVSFSVGYTFSDTR